MEALTNSSVVASADEGSREAHSLTVLMAAYQAGEMAAFEEVYRLLQPPLRRYLASLTRDSERAEDLLQETFLQIHRSRHTYLPSRPVRPWAFGIARHVYLMARRTGIRHDSILVGSEEDFVELAEPLSFDCSGHRIELCQAIAKLPMRNREPLLLHHVWGFSFKEIAGILGIREGAAKVRAHRAMASLRASLGEINAS